MQRRINYRFICYCLHINSLFVSSSFFASFIQFTFAILGNGEAYKLPSPACCLSLRLTIGDCVYLFLPLFFCYYDDVSNSLQCTRCLSIRLHNLLIELKLVIVQVTNKQRGFNPERDKTLVLPLSLSLSLVSSKYLVTTSSHTLYQTKRDIQSKIYYFSE